MVIDSPLTQKKFCFNYSKKLIFKNFEEELLIKNLIRNKPLLEGSEILGLQYAQEISSGYMPEVEIRYISENCGYGLFTKKDFLPGDYIGEYTGLIMADSSYLKMYNYLFKYPVQKTDGRYYSIDAEPYGNHTRFINHSFQPNLNKSFAFLNDLYHMIFVCNKKIAKGHQLTFDYGKNYWYLRGAPEIF